MRGGAGRGDARAPKGEVLGVAADLRKTWRARRDKAVMTVLALSVGIVLGIGAFALWLFSGVQS